MFTSNASKMAKEAAKRRSENKNVTQEPKAESESLTYV
jgi:hypothetical protein